MRKSSSTNDILDDLERSKRANDTTTNASFIKQQQQQQQQLKINNSKPDITSTKTGNNNTVINNVPFNKNLPVNNVNNNKNVHSTPGNDGLLKNTSAINLANEIPSSRMTATGGTTTTTPKAVNVNELYTVVDKSSASKSNVAVAVAKATKQQQGTKHDGKPVTDSLYTNIDTIQPTKTVAKNGNISSSSGAGVSVSNTATTTTKVVQKPPPPTFGVERNRSSVKKGIMEDKKKASLEKKNCKLLMCSVFRVFMRRI